MVVSGLESGLHPFAHEAILFHGKTVIGWEMDFINIIIKDWKTRT